LNLAIKIALFDDIVNCADEGSKYADVDIIWEPIGCVSVERSDIVASALQVGRDAAALKLEDDWLIIGPTGAAEDESDHTGVDDTAIYCNIVGGLCCIYGGVVNLVIRVAHLICKGLQLRTALRG